VVDHGPGIPDDAKSQVFDRFTRLDRGRHRAAGGAGLGLAIVASIAAAHGGRVRVGDTPGGGATFSIVLPTSTPVA
jgi:two-component system OmpR family sensor kinase